MISQLVVARMFRGRSGFYYSSTPALDHIVALPCEEGLQETAFPWRSPPYPRQELVPHLYKPVVPQEEIFSPYFVFPQIPRGPAVFDTFVHSVSNPWHWSVVDLVLEEAGLRFVRRDGSQG
jgi:hypothetical protein